MNMFIPMLKPKQWMFRKFSVVPAVAENEEMIKSFEPQVDLLDSRTGFKKPTKTQKENEGIKDTIYEVLCESDTPMRVKDLIADERLSNYSSSRITALLGQMLPEKGDGRITQIIEKKVAYSIIA